jgi:hypothetical protein
MCLWVVEAVGVAGLEHEGEHLLVLAWLEDHASVVGWAIAGEAGAFAFEVVDGFDVEIGVELRHLVFVLGEDAEVVEVHGNDSSPCPKAAWPFS